jgi:hypothetical protein
MKPHICFIAIFLIVFSCKEETKPTGNQIFKIDSAIEKEAKAAIKDIDSKSFGLMGGAEPAYDFSSHINAKFFTNDSLDEQIDESSEGLSAKYYWGGDTLNLLVYLGDYSTDAFFVRICRGVATVRYLKGHHENVNIYKLRLSDTASQFVEVPCYDYKLIISRLPDTALNQTIYGYFSFKSDNFYHWYDGEYQSEKWEDDHKKLRTNMASYFRANYQKTWWK